MRSTLMTRIATLMQEMLASSGWLRAELRRLDQAGAGDPRMRRLCDLLDSLDTSVAWDLRDELGSLSSRSSPQAAYVLRWLRADIDPLAQFVCRLDQECRGHPLVTVAMIACGDIVGRFMDLERELAPTDGVPRAGSGMAPAWPSPLPAAELPLLC